VTGPHPDVRWQRLVAEHREQAARLSASQAVTDRWSDLTLRRRRIAAWIRVAVAASSAVLVGVFLVAAARSQPINSGGDCGGKGCPTNLRRFDFLVAAGILAVLFIVAVAWPWWVRRWRDASGPRS
jgi:uncharacterized membrane protein YhaH (DUF805 family)